MSDGHHPDPIREAFTVASRDVVQILSIAAGSARVLMRHSARRARLRNEQEALARREARARERAERATARARWAPANDPSWLREAGLVDTATAWVAAVPHADSADPGYEPSAASAVRNCEARLRDLHPHAMARYDRLRSDGLGPMEAMREAAPLFQRPPRIASLDLAARPELAAGSGDGQPWALRVHGPSREEFEAYRRERRASRTMERLQARALRAEGALLGADELRDVLERTTNLPAEVIAKVAGYDAGVGGPAAGPVARRPWEDEFPFLMPEVLAVTASRDAATASAAREITSQRASRGRASGTGR